MGKDGGSGGVKGAGNVTRAQQRNLETLDNIVNKHLTDKNLTPNSNQIRLNSLKSINSFLIQTYIKKIILEYSNEKIEAKEVFEKLVPLLTKIPNDIKINGKSITIIDDSLMMEIIKDAFSDYKISEDTKTISK